MGTLIESLKNNKISELNFLEYWTQCRILSYAAEENFRLFKDVISLPDSLETNLKQRGFFHATLLLRAVAIENLIKARVLFQMQKDNSISKYNSIKEIINIEWGRDAHQALGLCKKYHINLVEPEKKFIENHLDHMDWAGRFPFPRNKNNIKSEQKLSENQNEIMKNLITRLGLEMNLHLEPL